MRLNVYCIFDTATGAYMRPFFLHADGQAVRMFTDIAADADHEVGKHPEDYFLVRIGVWDDQTAEFAQESVSTLITGLEAVASSRKMVPGTLDAFEQEVSGNGERDSRQST